MAMLRPWVNRRKTLRGQAIKKYPGQTVQWIDSQLHFTKLVDGKLVSLGLVPGVETVPKGPYTPSKQREQRKLDRAEKRNPNRRLAAQ